jgi:acyl-CoA thioesterase FadM
MRTFHERRDAIEVKIYYEDTDCGGVVYYANYLKYFERARTAYLEMRGYSVAALRRILLNCLDPETYTARRSSSVSGAAPIM